MEILLIVFLGGIDFFLFLWKDVNFNFKFLLILCVV